MPDWLEIKLCCKYVVTKRSNMLGLFVCIYLVSLGKCHRPQLKIWVCVCVFFWYDWVKNNPVGLCYYVQGQPGWNKIEQKLEAIKKHLPFCSNWWRSGVTWFSCKDFLLRFQKVTKESKSLHAFWVRIDVFFLQCKLLSYTTRRFEWIVYAASCQHLENWHNLALVCILFHLRYLLRNVA